VSPGQPATVLRRFLSKLAMVERFDTVKHDERSRLSVRERRRQPARVAVEHHQIEIVPAPMQPAGNGHGVDERDPATAQAGDRAEVSGRNDLNRMTSSYERGGKRLISDVDRRLRIPRGLNDHGKAQRTITHTASPVSGERSTVLHTNQQPRSTEQYRPSTAPESVSTRGAGRGRTRSGRTMWTPLPGRSAAAHVCRSPPTPMPG